MKLKCPSCWGKFHAETVNSVRFCPLCGYDTNEENEKEAANMAAILSSGQPPHYSHAPIKKTVDKLYRDSEAASQTRMEMAAEASGADISELSSMKMTDWKDNLREGDTAFVPANNAVTQNMAALQAAGGSVGFTRDPNIESYRAGVTTGAHPRSSLATLGSLQAQTFHRTPDHIAAKV